MLAEWWLQAALKQFQLLFRTAAQATGNLDAETIDQLQLRYGEQISVERPPT